MCIYTVSVSSLYYAIYTVVVYCFVYHRRSVYYPPFYEVGNLCFCSTFYRECVWTLSLYSCLFTLKVSDTTKQIESIHLYCHSHTINYGKKDNKVKWIKKTYEDSVLSCPSFYFKRFKRNFCCFSSHFFSLFVIAQWRFIFDSFHYLSHISGSRVYQLYGNQCSLFINTKFENVLYKILA